MSKLAKGDKGLFEAVDGAYYATVRYFVYLRENAAVVKLFTREHAAREYVRRMNDLNGYRCYGWAKSCH